MTPYLLAIRPKTLIASVSPVLIGTLIARQGGSFDFFVFLCTLLTGMGIQISTNLANDLFDFLKGADTEHRKGPIRVTQSGLMSIAQVKWSTAATMAFTALLGSFLVIKGGLVIALLLALALVLALAYTAGPFPLAYLGIAEIFILIFFGPVATGSAAYLQTGALEATPFFAGFAPGMLSCSLLVINNLRDIAEDKEAKKKTLVARFGSRFGKWEFAFFAIASCLVPLLSFDGNPLHLLPCLCLIPAAFLAKRVFQTQDPYEYNPLLGKTGALLTLYTLTFFLSTYL